MALGDLFKKFRGTTTSIFQLGIGGPQLKRSGNDLQVRNAADSANANLEVATPTTGSHAVNKTYADGLSGSGLTASQVMARAM